MDNLVVFLLRDKTLATDKMGGSGFGGAKNERMVCFEHRKLSQETRDNCAFLIGTCVPKFRFVETLCVPWKCSHVVGTELFFTG